MSDIAYAVHTDTCSYLLDDEGICRWVLSPTGAPVPGADRCVGAQFVACLDLTSEAGLVGELAIGATALFVRMERGRYVLLRTAPIEHVEFRLGEDAEAAQQPPEEEDAPPLPTLPPPPPPPVESPIERTQKLPVFSDDDELPRYPSPPPPAPPPAYAAPYTLAQSEHELPLPAFDSFTSISDDAIELDVEDLVSFAEITLTNPLFRQPSNPFAEPSTAPLPPEPLKPRPRWAEATVQERRSLVGQGRKLR